MTRVCGRLALRHEDDRAVVQWVAVLLVFDLVVAFAAYRYRGAFQAAPRNAFVVPGDDPGYALAGLMFDACAALRLLALLGCVCGFVWWRRVLRRSGRDGRLSRAWRITATVAVALELAAARETWVVSDPTTGWLALTLLACGLTTVVAVTLASQLLTLRVRRSTY
jgi:hypothetical protein